MVHSDFSEMPVQWAFSKEQNESADFWGTHFGPISAKKWKKMENFYATLNSQKNCLKLVDKFRPVSLLPPLIMRLAVLSRAS